MELPDQMAMFAQVAAAGSISAAARQLGQSPSAVSKRLSHLEHQLSTRLLTRSKTGIVLTEEGRAFHAHCLQVVRAAEDARAQMQAFGERPRGLLRLTSTVAFGKAQLLPAMAGFLGQYPEVEIDARFTDEPVDMAADRIDVAVQITEQIVDETLMARKLARNARVLCAAPAYVERHGTPRAFADLAGHNCLRLSSVALWNEWHPADGAEEVPPPVLSGNFSANSADAVYHAALAGIGIARLSQYLVDGDIRAGRLVRLLPGYVETFSDIHAVYPAGRHMAPKVRAFIDHLVGVFTPVPPWET